MGLLKIYNRKLILVIRIQSQITVKILWAVGILFISVLLQNSFFLMQKKIEIRPGVATAQYNNIL